MKTTWNIINELLGKQKSMQGIQKLTINGTQLTNQQDIANTFNKYFSSVNSESNSDNLENIGYNTLFTYSNSEQGKGIFLPHLFFKSFSTQEIIWIIKSLKSKNSFEYDEINTKLLKISVNYICSPLTHICNKSI
jgi:hypothetical protein